MALTAGAAVASCLPYRINVALAIGQSNLIGWNGGGTSWSKIDPLVKAWNNGNPLGGRGDRLIMPVRGEPPFNQAFPGANNFPIWFCDLWARDTARPTALVMIARGATKIRDFAPGGEFYDETLIVYRATGLGPAGVLLWHQGEADERVDYKWYLEQFAATVAGLRRDGVLAANAPVIAGGFTPAVKRRIAVALERAARKNPLMGFASSEGLASGGSSPRHFLGPAYELLADRYYAEFKRLTATQ